MKNPEMGSSEPEEIPVEKSEDKKAKQVSRRGFLKVAIGAVAGAAEGHWPGSRPRQRLQSES